MRTTLAIDDDVFEEVKQYAARRDVSLGRAASDLIRRGISQPSPTTVKNGLRVFSRSAASVPLPLTAVRRLDGDQDLHKVR